MVTRKRKIRRAHKLHDISRSSFDGILVPVDMSFTPQVAVDVLVGQSKQRDGAVHCVLILISQDRQTGTSFHTVGNPALRQPYSLVVNTNTRLNQGIHSFQSIGTINATDVHFVFEVAPTIQLQPSQEFVRAMVGELERVGLLHSSEAANSRNQMTGRWESMEKTIKEIGQSRVGGCRLQDVLYTAFVLILMVYVGMPEMLVFV